MKTENIFLTYLNYPISENPDNLDEIFEVIKIFEREQFRALYSGVDFESLNRRIEIRPNLFATSHEAVYPHIKRLLRSGYQKSMMRHPLIMHGQDRHVSIYELDYYQTAYDATWGNQDDPCADTCSHRESCFVCNQEKFKDKVQSIIAGDELYVLRYYLQSANECTKIASVISRYPEGTFFKDKIESVRYFSPPSPLGHTSVLPFNCYSEFVDSIMGYSISCFLAEPPQPRQKDCGGQPNRFKLKQCGQCRKFYVIDRLPMDMSLAADRTFCSDKCRAAYHNRHQDRDELNKYRRKQYSGGNVLYFPK